MYTRNQEQYNKFIWRLEEENPHGKAYTCIENLKECDLKKKNLKIKIEFLLT